MKQVLFVGAGNRFPNGVFNFLYALQLQERVHARALFFQPLDYAAMATAFAPGVRYPLAEDDTKERERMAELKAQFARQCEQHYILYDIANNDQGWNKDLLLKESRFADVILVSGELFCEEDPNQPNTYLRECLHTSECPVIIVPANFEKVLHIYMAYDGSKESVYAMKLFCYLFPQMIDLPTEVIFAREEESRDIPDLDLLKNFTKQKLDCMSFSKLHFKPGGYFHTWISDKKNSLLVAGSFGRSGLSYLTKHSFAEEVIRDHAVPLFIAHP